MCGRERAKERERVCVVIERVCSRKSVCSRERERQSSGERDYMCSSRECM